MVARNFKAVPGVESQSDLITFDPTGTGAVERTVQDKLRDTVSVKDFGAVGDGVQDDTLAIQAALNSGASVVLLAEQHFITNQLTVPANVSVRGDGISTITVDFTALPPPTTDFNRNKAFVLSTGTTVLENIIITTVVANRTDSRNGASMDPLVDGVSVTSGSYLKNVKAQNCWMAFVGGGTNLRFENCSSSDTKFASFNIYNATDVSVIGGTFLNCGGFGGLTFPSCKKVRVEGTYVTNLESTGINPGGSSSAGFNAADIVISNNIVYAREAINPENGVEGCTITGNLVYFGGSDPSTGSGIGVATHTGGGPISNVTITGNTVNTISGLAGTQLSIVVGSTNAFVPENITISSNTTTGRLGLYVQGTCNNMTVSDNVFNTAVYGVRFNTVTNLKAHNNFFNCITPTTVGNYYGVWIENVLTNATLYGNTTRGYGAHYRQELNCVNTTIFDCTFVRNTDNAAFTEIQYSGSVTSGLSVNPRVRMLVATGSNPSINLPETFRSGFATLTANVNGAPESNESTSVYFVMNSINGSSTGYTASGVSLTSLASLKHDSASSIPDCSLSGSSTTNVISVISGGFNTFTLTFLPLDR